MYNKTIEFSKTFDVFEPGDIIEETHTSLLYPGKYRVVRCHEPEYYGDEVIVFVEGFDRGFNGANFRLSNNSLNDE